jgi:hypothetical protein
MRAARPFVVGVFGLAILGVIAFGLFQKDSVSVPEPAALVLLGTGLFASAEARRHLLKN